MKAIVYTSNTGHTAAYAQLLGKRTGLPVYAAEAAKKQLAKGTPILYLGWLMAGSVKGYRKAAKRYQIAAVYGVGLCATGALLEEVRKGNAIPAGTPLFTLQGGIDHARLRGLYKSMINTLTRFMAKKKDRSADEDEMLRLLGTDGNYVSEANLSAVLAWYAEMRDVEHR